MRRLLPVLVGVLVVLGGLYGLLAVVNERDSAGLDDSAAAGPGVLEKEGAGGDPPTSGDHERVNPTSQRRLTRDQLLTALELGNVVIVHPPGRTPAALGQLQEAVSGPFDPELAAAGQMVVVSPWPGVEAVQALAYRRRLRASGPGDPRLREFAEAWLGKGAAGAR